MINIDDMKYGDLKKIASMFAAQPIEAAQGISAMVGKKCIVRTYSAGVWFGEVAEKSGNEVILKNARRMWRWHAAESISLSAVAIHGIYQGKSKIVSAVPAVWLEAIELIPASETSILSIEGAPNVQAD